MTTTTTAREITLHTRVTEIETPLPGSRSWVAKVIEESEVVIGKTTDGHPAIFLLHPEGFGDRKRNFQLVADYGDTPERGWPSQTSKRVDCWPFWDAGLDGAPRVFGIAVTKAGQQLMHEFGRKCATLLRLTLRRQDKSTSRRLRIKILD